MTVKTALLVVLVAIVVYYLWTHMSTEDFATKQDKAKAAYEWFKSTDKPTYVEYRKSVPDSDIVEYERARTQVAMGGGMGAITSVM